MSQSTHPLFHSFNLGENTLSNPDLVRRLKTGMPLAEPEKDSFYHGGPKGYIDYPEYPI